MIATPIDSDENNSSKYIEAFIKERNTLRRFLAGLTATTLGVLTALHSHNMTLNWTGWLYVGSILSNACSVIFLLCSLFGQSKNLKIEAQNACLREWSMYSGKEYEPIQSLFSQRFTYYTYIGVVSYIIAILLMCAYVVSEMVIAK